MAVAALVLGTVGGVFGIISAIFALGIGGLGTALGTANARQVIELGWGALACSFVGFAGAGFSLAKPGLGAQLLLIAAIGITISISWFAVVAGPLFLLAALFADLSRSPESICEEWGRRAEQLHRKLQELRIPPIKEWPRSVRYATAVALVLGWVALAYVVLRGGFSTTQTSVQVRPEDVVTLDLGRRPSDFGTQGQSQELLALMSQRPGKRVYGVYYTTAGETVILESDLYSDILTLTHRGTNNTSQSATWNGHVMERLKNGANGGSMNDTPAGKSFATMTTIRK